MRQQNSGGYPRKERTMTDKQPEALIRAEELEQIGAESSLARAMAAHTIRLLYKENEALRTRLSQCERCGEVNPAEIHTCSPQEPVAWFCELPDNKISIKIVGKPTEGNWKPLYTTPPQREWQGLTDEDWIIGKRSADYIAGAEWAEAKLKEKNSA
jgi:hypothetical protein